MCNKRATYMQRTGRTWRTYCQEHRPGDPDLDCQHEFGWDTVTAFYRCKFCWVRETRCQQCGAHKETPKQRGVYVFCDEACREKFIRITGSPPAALTDLLK